MTQPEILTTVVGSYPVPEWLRIYPNRVNLRDATMVVLKTQELAGIDVVADGELYRFDVNHPETNGMIDYFIGRMSGISLQPTPDEIAAFEQDSQLSYRQEPAGVVRSEIGVGTLNLPRDCRRVRELTRRKLKFTLTGPHMLTKVLTDAHYRDRSRLCMSIARQLRAQVEQIDADVVQVDEANISGHPEDSAWAAECINEVLDGIRTERALHICFGNYGGQTVQTGWWKNLIPFLQELRVNHLVLEFARRGYDELEYFRDLNPEIGMGIGVIDIKDNEIESPDVVAGRMETAVNALGPHRVRYVHPDCGFWMLQRSVADGKMRALVAGRDLFLGRS